MIAIDEDALICDLAETYQIYDYRSLPAKLAATLSVGLRENSRIKIKMRGDKLGDSDRMILGMIFDIVAKIGWMGEDKPPSMIDAMYGELPEKTEAESETQSFDSPEAYEQARKELIERRQRCRT